MRTFTFILIGSCLSFSLSANQDALGKYSLILENGLFGKEIKTVTVPVPTPVPPPAAAGWAKPFQMTMMSQEAGTNRIRVGLQNTQSKSSMLLIEGEGPSPDGYQVMESDFDRKQATVVYGGVPHVFDLTKGSAPVTATNRQTRPTTGRTQFRRRSSNTNVRPRPTPTPRPQQAQTRQWKSREEYQKHLQAQNEDAIRTGKPPLPIPLTAEQDARLVRDGVLPPQ